jgi:hypothetical protein
MVCSEGGKTDDRKKPDKRQSERKAVPQGNFPVIIGQPDGTFKIAREIDRKKPIAPMPARLLVAQNANCTVENVSAEGLCICSVAKLNIGQWVGIFFQISPAISTEEKGFTLICEVRWHQVNQANQMAYLTGLRIIENSDSPGYQEFVASLPTSSQAHA